jgi:hypothetical protein
MRKQNVVGYDKLRLSAWLCVSCRRGISVVAARNCTKIKITPVAQDLRQRSISPKVQLLSIYEKVQDLVRFTAVARKCSRGESLQGPAQKGTGTNRDAISGELPTVDEALLKFRAV